MLKIQNNESLVSKETINKLASFYTQRYWQQQQD